MEAKKQVKFTSFEFDEDGNLIIVFPEELFTVIREAINAGQVDECKGERRVRINVSNFGHGLKVIKALLRTDQPPCYPDPKNKPG